MPGVFIDSNVAVYAAGRDHPLKAPCIAILEAVGVTRTCVASAEVLHEILNVYQRRGALAVARQVLRDFDETLDGRIEPVTREDALRAAEFDLPSALQARDRVHLAVMERLGITRIISADTAYDAAPGIERLDPRTLASWRDAVFAAEA